MSKWTFNDAERPVCRVNHGVLVSWDADMADAIRTGRTHRANGALAYHVLDLMHAFHDASDKGTHVAIESTCEKPALMPEGLFEGNW